MFIRSKGGSSEKGNRNQGEAFGSVLTDSLYCLPEVLSGEFTIIRNTGRAS